MKTAYKRAAGNPRAKVHKGYAGNSSLFCNYGGARKQKQELVELTPAEAAQVRQGQKCFPAPSPEQVAQGEAGKVMEHLHGKSPVLRVKGSWAGWAEGSKGITLSKIFDVSADTVDYLVDQGLTVVRVYGDGTGTLLLTEKGANYHG